VGGSSLKNPEEETNDTTSIRKKGENKKKKGQGEQRSGTSSLCKLPYDKYKSGERSGWFIPILWGLEEEKKKREKGEIVSILNFRKSMKRSSIPFNLRGGGGIP